MSSYDSRASTGYEYIAKGLIKCFIHSSRSRRASVPRRQRKVEEVETDMPGEHWDARPLGPCGTQET